MPLLHSLLQIFLCGGYYPGIDIDVAFSAEPRKFAILKNLKELRLQGDIDCANFIQEDGSAIGQLEFPRLSGMGPGESPFFKTKQFAFNQFPRDGSAVDLDEGLVSLSYFEKMALATSSLPVPLSPLINTGISVGAIWSMTAFSLTIFELLEKSSQ